MINYTIYNTKTKMKEKHKDDFDEFKSKYKLKKEDASILLELGFIKINTTTKLYVDVRNTVHRKLLKTLLG